MKRLVKLPHMLETLMGVGRTWWSMVIIAMITFVEASGPMALATDE